MSQKLKNLTKDELESARKWALILAILEILVIIALFPYTTYVFFPEAADAARGFAYLYIWLICAQIAFIIAIISTVLLIRTRKYANCPTELRQSLIATLTFAISSIIPMLMLFLSIPALIVDLIVQIKNLKAK